MKSSRSHRTLSEVEYRLTGHLGNTTVLFRDADEDGQIAAEGSGPAAAEVMQRLWYYPFGLQLQGIGRDEPAPAHLYRYNGKAWDPASGLSDYGARWYDAGSGRWSGVDPLASKMPSWSPYSYTFNNPVLYTDPDGRIPIPIILGAIGAAIEYSSQVYSNYQSGATGYDAWVGNVDFADVTVEGIATGTGTKFIGDIAVEGVKASLDINGNGTVSHIGDGSEDKQVANVLKSTAENSVFSLAGNKVGKKVNKTFSGDALKNANSDVVAAKKNLRKAKNKAGTNYSRSPEVYKRDLQLAGARDRQAIRYIGNDLGLGTEAGKVVTEKLTSSQVANIKSFIENLE